MVVTDIQNYDYMNIELGEQPQDFDFFTIAQRVRDEPTHQNTI